MFSDEGDGRPHTLILVIRADGEPERFVDTRLGVLISDEVAYIPFSSVENAVDCLRILIRRLQADRS